MKRGATFAGHSLGEYAALAAFANVLNIEALMDVVFYRGMTMQFGTFSSSGLFWGCGEERMVYRQLCVLECRTLGGCENGGGMRVAVRKQSCVFSREVGSFCVERASDTGPTHSPYSHTRTHTQQTPAVKRNKDGTSDYGMIAANPSRVGGGFNEGHLHAVVDTVSRIGNNALIQVKCV